VFKVISVIHLKIIYQCCKIFDLDLSILYECKVGIKCTNQLVSSEMFNYFVSGETKSVHPENLYLTFDGLKDSYTLLARSVVNSPHFELMQILQDGGDVLHSDYLSRVVNGTLDFRSGQKIGNNYTGFLRNKYNERINSIENDLYIPVKIFKVNEKYYIADGKHTAAVCALVGVSPRCIDVSTLVYDSFFWWIYRKMLKHRANYLQHIEFFESLLNENIPEY